MTNTVAVEAKATLRLRTRYGPKRYADFSGTFAVRESDIAIYVERLPYRVTILDRAPTQEEVAASIAAGLLPNPAAKAARAAPAAPTQSPETSKQQAPSGGAGDPASTGSPAQPPEKRFSDANKDVILDIAGALGLDTDGTKADVLERVSAYAEMHQISLEGTISEVTARLTPKTGSGTE